MHGEVLGGAVIGGMLSISSTAVAMKMMEDAGEKDSTAGRLALAILVAQDLAVVPLLLITGALGAPFSPQGMVLIAGKLVLALALLGGFIAVLGKVKSFRFPWSEYLLKDFDIGTLGRAGNLFHRRGGLGPSGPVTRAGRVSGRTGGGPFHAAGAARSPWRSRFRASFCSCSSCRWGF